MLQRQNFVPLVEGILCEQKRQKGHHLKLVTFPLFARLA